VIEANLYERLRLDTLDVESHLSEVDVHTHVQLHEVEHLRLKRDVSVEILELEMDRVDLDHRHVEEDVGISRVALARGVIAVLALRHGPFAVHVLGEPVLLRLLRGLPTV
jgi:hypothetical protein